MTETAKLEPLLLEALLDSSVDGVLAFDGQFRYLFWNASMEAMSGLRAADVIGQRAFELFPFLVQIGEDEYFRRALAGEAVISRDRPFSVPGTNHRGFFEGHYRPLRSETGEIVGAVGIIRDITDEKLAHDQITETEARFRNMADIAPVLLWMSKTDGLCTFFNQTWLTFTGRTLEDEWGVGWAEGVHYEDFQHCMDTYVAAFNDRRVLEMEYRLRRADGEYRWILDRGTPRYTPDGTFAGYIGSCVDITAQKAIEGELRASVRERDEFLSIASHELKTPLTSLQLQVDMLARAVEKPTDPAAKTARIGQVAQTIVDQTVRLGRLVDTLLDVSRLVSGRCYLELSDVDLGLLVRDVAKRWAPIAARATCDLSVHVAQPGSDKPGSTQAGSTTGRWDRFRLEQVVDNLLSNATKYGAGKPIRVQVDGDSAVARVIVKDHGIGIASDNHDKIFERFERAASSKNYGGLGLGLWITREIVRAQGGSVKVESALGQGTTFVVELPRSR